MNAADILDRLAVHEADHAAFNTAVLGWLAAAGFHPDVQPCRVVRHLDCAGVWCGAPKLSSSRSVQLDWTHGIAVASISTYGGQKHRVVTDGATPDEALRALVATGKVPKALLRPP